MYEDEAPAKKACLKTSVDSGFKNIDTSVRAIRVVSKEKKGNKIVYIKEKIRKKSFFIKRK